MNAVEANFDGLVGPTHNYAGLSYGNVASMSHKAQNSNPKEAALQGLKKMKALHDMGYVQGVLAPQERPDVHVLRQLGFRGADAKVLQSAQQAAPEVLAACASAASMWTANAATICPSSDAGDGKVHFTAANLINKFHRSIEAETTSRLLRAMFPGDEHFAHHAALPTGAAFGDEGAANHTRFCDDYGQPGLQMFVYGRLGLGTADREPSKFPARQTLEASQAIARLHRVPPDRAVYVQQNPEAIDAGAFHNDVVSVGNKNALFYHERAFVDGVKAVNDLRSRFEALADTDFHAIQVSAADVPLADAVKSYLFNSQLLSRPDGGMCLIAPTDCQETPSVDRYLKKLLSEKTPIRDVKFFNVKQSMQNGGGPACLRLRVVLNEAERQAANPHVIMSEDLFATLNAWVEKHYRDRLSAADLADPQLLTECRTALDELTQLLHLGSIYPFQL